MTKTIKVKSKPQPSEPEKQPTRAKDVPIAEKLYLTPKDVMILTGCSKNVVHEWFRIEGFPLMKVGNKRLVKRELFFEWFERKFSVTHN